MAHLATTETPAPERPRHAGPWRADPNSPRRAAILAYVAANPGQSFRRVAAGTGLANGVLRHHVNVLRRDGRIHELRVRSRLHLFPSTGPTMHGLITNLVGAPGHDLIAVLRTRPGLNQKAILDLVESRGANRSTTQHRLNRLEALGALTTIRGPRTVRYYPAEA